MMSLPCYILKCTHYHAYDYCQLIHSYGNTFTESDYYASPSSVRLYSGRTAASITISTREDSKLEEKEEAFTVSLKYPSKQNNKDCYDTATVVISDDDGMYVYTQDAGRQLMHLFILTQQIINCLVIKLYAYFRFNLFNIIIALYVCA